MSNQNNSNTGGRQKGGTYNGGNPKPKPQEKPTPKPKK